MGNEKRLLGLAQIWAWGWISARKEKQALGLQNGIELGPRKWVDLGLELGPNKRLQHNFKKNDIKYII